MCFPATDLNKWKNNRGDTCISVLRMHQSMKTMLFSVQAVMYKVGFHFNRRRCALCKVCRGEAGRNEALKRNAFSLGMKQDDNDDFYGIYLYKGLFSNEAVSSPCKDCIFNTVKCLFMKTFKLIYYRHIWLYKKMEGKKNNLFFQPPTGVFLVK